MYTTELKRKSFNIFNYYFTIFLAVNNSSVFYIIELSYTDLVAALVSVSGSTMSPHEAKRQ